MRTIFQAELESIGDDLITLSRRVEQAISTAGSALMSGDLTLAESVIADDQAIDAIEEDLDERCVLVLAQQSPVARDLRVVVTALRMSASLERMGDLARHIAEVARRCYPERALPEPLLPTFAQMHDAATRVASRVTQLLQTRDLAVAEAIEQDDDTLDTLHLDTFAAMLESGWTGTVQETINVTLLGRYYERFGDHGVSVAKRAAYLVTGDLSAERTTRPGA